MTENTREAGVIQRLYVIRKFSDFYWQEEKITGEFDVYFGCPRSPRVFVGAVFQTLSGTVPASVQRDSPNRLGLFQFCKLTWIRFISLLTDSSLASS